MNGERDTVGESRIGYPVDSTEQKVEAASEPAPSSQHHTLKYHLLGPSLTKAGQDSVDQKKVRHC
jgi:DNA polymerase kappa